MTSGNVAKARRNPRKERVRTGVRSLSTGGISPLLAGGFPATLADMRCRLAVLVLAVAGAGMLTAPAVAAESVATLELAPNGVAAAPKRFTLAGVHWRGTGNVAFRTRSLAGRWSAWRPAAARGPRRPRPRLARRPAAALRLADREPVVGRPVRPDRDALDREGLARSRVPRLEPGDSSAHALPRSCDHDDATHRVAELVGRQRVDPARAAGLRDVDPRRDDPPHGGHEQLLAGAGAGDRAGASSSSTCGRTAGTTSVTTFSSTSFGTIYEGRFGGVDRNVIGAHARGFNTGSVGIALLGTYISTAPSQAAQDAIARLIAWRLDLAHVDPLAKSLVELEREREVTAGCESPAPGASPGTGRPGATTCPGDVLFGRLDALAGAASKIGLPKIYEPLVEDVENVLRFRARLSSKQSWYVSITDAAGVEVARGTGTGKTVDFTWDATLVPNGQYTWTIGAGSARVATGPLRLEGANAPLAVEALATPAGDHAERGRPGRRRGPHVQADRAGERHDSGRTTPRTSSLPRSSTGVWTRAGEHTVTVPGAALADGVYSVIVTARTTFEPGGPEDRAADREPDARTRHGHAGALLAECGRAARPARHPVPPARAGERARARSSGRSPGRDALRGPVRGGAASLPVERAAGFGLDPRRLVRRPARGDRRDRHRRRRAAVRRRLDESARPDPRRNAGCAFA